jgi:hypothetical protein
MDAGKSVGRSGSSVLRMFSTSLGPRRGRWPTVGIALALLFAAAAVLEAQARTDRPPAVERRPAGPALSARGVAAVEVPAQASGNATIRLFGADQKEMATVQLEDQGRDNFTFRVRRSDGDGAWVRVQRGKERSGVAFDVSSSAGGAFRVLADPTKETPGAGPVPVSELQIEVQGERRTIALNVPPDAEAGELRLAGNLEHELIFTTPTLGLLEDTLADYGTFFEQNSPAKTCEVACFRIFEILPVFLCVTKDCSCPAGTGVFLGSPCSGYFLCKTDCSSFGPIV